MFIRSPDGKPLLSWRVEILPFLDQQELYDAFHLDEPWDSPHNKPLLSRMPKEYAPRVPTKIQHATYFKVFVGTGSMFEPESIVDLTSIRAKGSMTILAVQAGEPVPWTKPEDIPFTPNEPLPKVTGPIKGGFLALMVNGSVHFVSETAKAEVVKAAIMRNDDLDITPEDLDPKKEQ